MSRVSENSTRHVIDHSLHRNKRRLEEMQLQGASLKSITKPSDNPIGNVESLAIKSRMADNKQYSSSAEFALTNLTLTEQSLESLTEIINKAKEIAIAQSSDFYSADARQNIANEITQLRNQALAIANKRIGQKYLFSGYKSLSPPFDTKGNYFGDDGHINIEVSKDFYVPINLTGKEIFFGTNNELHKETGIDPLKIKSEKDKLPGIQQNRDLASDKKADPNAGFTQQESIFSQLEVLSSALENDDTQLIQNSLERLDKTHSRLVTLRTRMGSLTNSIMTAKNNIESEQLQASARRSKIEDADITELFSDIMRQKNILTASYQTSQGMMQQSLLKFLR